MAFMEVQPLREPPPDPTSGKVFRADLLVHHPIAGELCLVMPEELLREIAAGIYGAPAEELERGKLCDILNEMLNTIAGLFLSRVLPHNQTFDLGIPKISESNCQPLDPTLLQWHFRADEGCFHLSAGGDAWRRLIRD
jgi:hypothetical protein